MLKKVLLLIWIMVTPIMAFSLFEEEPSDKVYLHLISSVKDVVISTQKTRGLTNSFMNGNVAAQLLVYAQREEMMKDLDTLKKVSTEAKLSKNYRAEMDTLIKNLKKLNKKALKKNAADVFDTYTQLIESWLVLNGKIIDARFKGGKQDIYVAVKMLNSTLLPLTENIGKLRGMGSGIAARGHCKAKEIPEMQSFITNIESYRVSMEQYFKSQGCKRLAPRELNNLKEQIDLYSQLAKTKVIGQNKITLDANKFFDQGQTAIDGVLKIYNAMEAEIESKL